MLWANLTSVILIGHRKAPKPPIQFECVVISVSHASIDKIHENVFSELNSDDDLDNVRSKQVSMAFVLRHPRLL